MLHLLAELGEDPVDAAGGCGPGGGLDDAVGLLEHCLQAPEGPVELPVYGVPAAVCRALQSGSWALVAMATRRLAAERQLQHLQRQLRLLPMTSMATQVWE